MLRCFTVVHPQRLAQAASYAKVVLLSTMTDLDGKRPGAGALDAGVTRGRSDLRWPFHMRGGFNPWSAGSAAAAAVTDAAVTAVTAAAAAAAPALVRLGLGDWALGLRGVVACHLLAVHRTKREPDHGGVLAHPSSAVVPRAPRAAVALLPHHQGAKLQGHHQGSLLTCPHRRWGRLIRRRRRLRTHTRRRHRRRRRRRRRRRGLRTRRRRRRYLHSHTCSRHRLPRQEALKAQQAALVVLT